MAARDFNDDLREGGEEKVRAAHDKARRHERKSNGQGTAGSYRFQLWDYGELKYNLVQQWAIKKLLPANGLALFYGAPGCGKSFGALHAVLHAAIGAKYAGHRTRQCRVIYIAAEGQGRFANRVLGACDGLGIQPRGVFKLITVKPNLGSAKGDAKTLINEIKAQLPDGVGIIVIDTVSRTMAGANENNEGMAAFIDNAGLVAETLGCLVIAIHHTGKDEEKGARGWSGIDGATDCAWKFSKNSDGTHSVCVKKMRDGEDGWTWNFELNQVEIGKDEDGEPATTCKVALLNQPSIGEKKQTGEKPRKRIPRSQAEFDQAFNEAVLDHGQDYQVDGDRAALVRAVYVDQIRPYFARRWAVDEPDKRKRQQKVSEAFRGVLKNLPQRYRVRAMDGGIEWIWRLEL